MVISDDILTKSGEISQKGLLFLFWAKYITFVHSVLFHMFKKLKIHEKIQKFKMAAMVMWTEGHVTQVTSYCPEGLSMFYLGTKFDVSECTTYKVVLLKLFHYMIKQIYSN